jgi:hypothetical protein
MKRLNILFDAPDDSGAGLEDFQADQSFGDAMAALDEADGVNYFNREEDSAEGDDSDDMAGELETPDDEPAGDSADDDLEAEPTGEQEADPEEEAPPPAFDLSVFDDALIPGAAVDSVDDVVEHMRSYRQSHEVLETFEKVVSADTALQNYLKAIQGGTDQRIAAQEAFGSLTSAPDPDEDPEAYADWKANKAVMEEKRKAEAKSAEQTQKQQQEISKQVYGHFEATVKRLDLDSDQAERLRSTFRSITQGDPVTGKYPPRAFDLLYHGMQYGQVQSEIKSVTAQAEKGNLKGLAADKSDHPLVAEVKTALRTAFTEGAKAPSKRRRDVGSVPDPTGSRKPSGSDNKELSDLASSLKKDNWWDHPAMTG